MRTSTAIRNKYRCPKCKGRVKRDRKGRGFSIHKDYGKKEYCDFEQGQRD